MKLTLRFHRPAYPAMDTPQQAYLLLEAAPSGQAKDKAVQAVNLGLVLDRSGSMSGAKLRSLKDAAWRVVERLSDSDLLSIVIFDDAEPADVVLPCSPVVDRQAIKRRIENISERGGTHMSTGMRLGLQELKRGQSPQRVSYMVLLTDGQTWEDAQACRELADESRKAGIPIQVIGLGVGAESNWDPRLLEDLAQRSGGDWLAIETVEQVGNVFEKMLSIVQGTAVSNALLTIRMAEGLTPRAVWRVKPLISRLDHQTIGANDVQVFLGDIQYEIGQSILADVLLPARRPGNYRLVQADILYDVPSSGLSGQRVSIDGVVSFTGDAAQVTPTDEQLMNIIERVVAHRLQTQALDEAAAGDLVRATQRLRAAATRLLELGEQDLAYQANQQADQIDQQGQLDLAAAQRMRYATRRLTEADLQE